MKDRLVSGAIAGGVASLAHYLYAGIAQSFGYQGPVYYQYGEIALLSRIQSGPLAVSLGVIGHFSWNVLIGIGFAYLIQLTTSHFHRFKAVLYSVIVWFMIGGVSTLYKIAFGTFTDPVTSLFFLIGSIFYGLIIATVLEYLDRVPNAL